jgi:hypothetical protein
MRSRLFQTRADVRPPVRKVHFMVDARRASLDHTPQQVLLFLLSAKQPQGRWSAAPHRPSPAIHHSLGRRTAHRLLNLR